MEIDETSDTFGVLLPFDTDAKPFALGFELGRLWTLLRERPDETIEEVVHAENAEMLIRIGEATDRDFTATDVDNAWVLVRYSPAGGLHSP